MVCKNDEDNPKRREMNSSGYIDYSVEIICQKKPIVIMYWRKSKKENYE